MKKQQIKYFTYKTGKSSIVIPSNVLIHEHLPGNEALTGDSKAILMSESS